MTGEITKLSAFEHKNGKTIVDITLPSEGSIFVVFREASKGVNSINPNSIKAYSNIKATLSNSNKILFEVNQNGNYNYKMKDGSTKSFSVIDLPQAINISNNWDVTFPDMKSKENIFTFPNLIDWTSHKNEGIKFYSGTASYTKTFHIDNHMLSKNNRLVLDLGEVNIAAKVMVNGNNLGVLWKAPFTVDVTSALSKGQNTIEIEITNQWTNRLIGDENYPNISGYDISLDTMPDWYTNNEPAPLGERSTFTTYPFYKKGDKLIPAGLIGPITISTSRLITK